MFSSISTMLWGEGEEASAPAPPLPRSESPAGEDWVLVGPSSPAPGDLGGSLEPLVHSATHSDTSSNPPSSSSSEAGEEEMVGAGAGEARAVNRGRPHAPTTRLDALAAAEVKSSKSAQLVKQRNSGKTLSSKAIKRSNKSILAEVGKRGAARSSFPIKMAGTNKNLKQC